MGLRPFCGGTLISKKCVLTAAHCLVNKWPSMINVLLGEHNWEDISETNNTDVLTVASIKIHPFYDSSTGTYTHHTVNV